MAHQVKRVLLIDSREGGDWSLDLLYAGLVQNLGYHNVIDYPTQQKHRMGRPELIDDTEKDWGAERRSLSYTSDHAHIPSYTKDQIKGMLMLGEIDTIFVDEREESFCHYLELRANFTDARVIVVAGHDRFWNESPEFVRTNYYGSKLKMMFLDNWRVEYDSLPYARLYNWSVNFDHLWIPPKKMPEMIYDISFMGYNSHPDRLRYIEHIRKRWSHLNLNLVLETRPNAFDNFVPKQEYFTQILQSKICLNLRGAAENGKTLRFYEIPYVGSYMVTQPVGKQVEDLNWCAYFNSEKELDDCIDSALEYENARNLASALCHAELMTRHTSKVRIEKMLEQING